jgi:hypothetical protein
MRQHARIEAGAPGCARIVPEVVKVSWHKRYYRCFGDFIPSAEKRE